MRKILVILLALMSFTSVSRAQDGATTTFAASNGTDTNNSCSTITNPCATVTNALNNIAVGGTLICLTPLTASTITILRSVTIDCPGLLLRGGGTAVFSASIDIAVPSADQYRQVRIKGITIDGDRLSGRNPLGIVIRSAERVILEDMTISNTSQAGLKDQRTTGQTRLYIKNSTFNYHGGPGIVAAAQGAAATVLDNVSLLNNAYGLAAATGNNVVITRSTISGNTTAGISADGGSQINLMNSVLSHNTANVNNFGITRLRDNDIQFSNVALQGNPVITMGGNRYSGNGSLGTVPASASGAPSDVFN